MAKLPYDAEVEYLSSDGNQFAVIRDFFTDDSLSVSGKFLQRNNNSVCGWNNTNCMTNTIQFRRGNSNVSAVAEKNAVHTFTWGAIGEACVLDGIFYGVSPAGNHAYNYLYIFARGDRNDVLDGNIYWMKVYLGGVMVKDIIPVRKGGVGFFYDKVDGKLYGNEGTGAFALGPDVAKPEPKSFYLGKRTWVEDGWVNPWVADGAVAVYDAASSGSADGKEEVRAVSWSFNIPFKVEKGGWTNPYVTAGSSTTGPCTTTANTSTSAPTPARESTPSGSTTAR